jgi:hypothetical protein
VDTRAPIENRAAAAVAMATPDLELFSMMIPSG